MTARDRVRTTIKLTSSEGEVFEALWRGNDRSMSKKLGKFDYPDFDGTVVQDLGATSWSYPLNIIFRGDDHDLEAQRFAEALYHRGPWDILHPVKGGLILQLESASEGIQPITDMDSTTFTLSFIEPVDPGIIASSEQISNTITSQAETSNASLAEQAASIKDSAFAQVEAVRNQAQKITTVIQSVLKPLAELVTEINNQFDQTVRAIQETLDAVILDPLTLAAQIQRLTQLPALAVTDFQARIDSYKELATEIFGIGPGGTTPDDYNKTLQQENVLGAVLVASAQITVSADFTTRSQVRDAIEQLNQLYSDIVENLDNSQKDFRGLDIDNQFFSQSLSYTDLSFLKALSIRLLLDSLFDLKIERRFITDTNRSPLEITITEYGDIGENDIFYNLFLTSNNLKNQDIELIQAGTEIVVYI